MPYPRLQHCLSKACFSWGAGYTCKTRRLLVSKVDDDAPCPTESHQELVLLVLVLLHAIKPKNDNKNVGRELRKVKNINNQFQFNFYVNASESREAVRVYG